MFLMFKHPVLLALLNIISELVHVELNSAIGGYVTETVCPTYSFGGRGERYMNLATNSWIDWAAKLVNNGPEQGGSLGVREANGGLVNGKVR